MPPLVSIRLLRVESVQNAMHDSMHVLVHRSYVFALTPFIVGGFAMSTSDTQTPAKIFKANFRKAFGEYRAERGESLSLFGEKHFGGGETIYNWLRRLWDEGSPFKREGTANHDRLKALHAALGVSWPSLWDQPKQDDLIERLTRLLASDHRDEVEKAVQDVVLRFENLSQAELLLAKLATERPALHQFLIENAEDLMQSISTEISHHGFEAVLNYLVETFGDRVSEKPAEEVDGIKENVTVEEPKPSKPPVPDADAVRIEGGKWWEEYALDFDDDDAAFAALTQSLNEFWATHDHPSVAQFWHQWNSGDD